MSRTADGSSVLPRDDVPCFSSHPLFLCVLPRAGHSRSVLATGTGIPTVAGRKLLQAMVCELERRHILATSKRLRRHQLALAAAAVRACMLSPCLLLLLSDLFSLGSAEPNGSQNTRSFIVDRRSVNCLLRLLVAHARALCCCIRVTDASLASAIRSVASGTLVVWLLCLKRISALTETCVCAVAVASPIGRVMCGHLCLAARPTVSAACALLLSLHRTLRLTDVHVRCDQRLLDFVECAVLKGFRMFSTPLKSRLLFESAALFELQV